MALNWILVGYMGCGKTSVGEALASLSSRPFYDLDALISEQQGQNIGEIFRKEGEAGFRKIEHRVLKDFLQHHTAYVLSVGGGAPCHHDHMALMNDRAKTVYIRANTSILFRRLQLEKSVRPMIAHIADNLLFEFISEHLSGREAFYEKAREWVDIGEKSIREIAEKIKEKYDSGKFKQGSRYKTNVE
ncbi:MAG: shikimate kinase [Flavobacteriales bacterium Tduv]